MRNIISSFTIILAFVLSAFYSSAEARIVETFAIEDILPEIESDTLVLLDIDDTLITSSCSLGSSAWWTHFANILFRNKLDMSKSEEILPPMILKIFEAVPARAIEAKAPALIRELQDRKITVLGLTARSRKTSYAKNFDLITRNQLGSIGISFEQSILPQEFQRKLPKEFAYGIIFTDQKLKGPVLVKFLQTLNYRPAKIVTLDDSPMQISSLDEALAGIDIPFVGFRYGRLDKQIERFDPLIGNIQMQTLFTTGQLLDDDQAREVAFENPTLLPNFYLMELHQSLILQE